MCITRQAHKKIKVPVRNTENTVESLTSDDDIKRVMGVLFVCNTHY